ncbi:hypothetical protein IFM89_037255 [Coptis chinensis]|uniref:Uncharacterized protein n=1 Tax=Coptis chinensis TaxID=261450 RepID=A0A835I891_9MAGN|nr:hypothetical protein IFM89_037255 [Coptis chinensis]
MLCRFLFDTGCADYKYYESRLIEEERLLAPTVDFQTRSDGNCTHSNHSIEYGIQGAQTPLVLKHQMVLKRISLIIKLLLQRYMKFNEDTPQAGSNSYGERSAPSASDPIAMMEFYMKKAAHEERRRQPKQSKDEMPPPASLHAASGKKGHHMGDYIPLEELEKFMANCNDVAAQKAAKEAAERSKIQADNVGHKLLSKMG